MESHHQRLLNRDDVDDDVSRWTRPAKQLDQRTRGLARYDIGHTMELHNRQRRLSRPCCKHQ